jgi:hypothetical protein
LLIRLHPYRLSADETPKSQISWSYCACCPNSNTAFYLVVQAAGTSLLPQVISRVTLAIYYRIWGIEMEGRGSQEIKEETEERDTAPASLLDEVIAMVSQKRREPARLFQMWKYCLELKTSCLNAK